MFVLLEKYDAEEGAMPIKAFAEEGAMETALVSHRQIDKKLLLNGSCIQRLSQIHKVSSMTPSMTPRRRRLNDLELNDPQRPSMWPRRRRLNVLELRWLCEASHVFGPKPAHRVD